MSITNRVNIFLERARQLSSSSPLKTTKVSKTSPHGDKLNVQQSKPAKKLTRPVPKSDIVHSLESMIDDLLESRYSVNKKIESHKQKELSVITELKKILDVEINKNKITDLQSCEKLYKEKNEKVLAIVRQEALNMDKKLSEITAENFKLKQALTAKNIEFVDKKIFGEKINGIITDKAHKTGNFDSQIKSILLLGYKNLFSDKIDDLIADIVGDNEYNLIPEICSALCEIKNTSYKLELDISNSFDLTTKHIGNLRLKIKDNPFYSQDNYEANFGDNSLDYDYRIEDNRKNQDSTQKSFGNTMYFDEDEIFMTNTPEVPESISITPKSILDSIYEEVLKDIED
jgi:hypothetical protein